MTTDTTSTQRPGKWILQGHIVPLAADAEQNTFAGRVWIEGESIVAVTQSATGANAPDGFDDAPLVDCGIDYVFPGLIDLHSHIAYNALPLWTHPAQTEPFLHHDIWPGRSSYGPKVSWPAWVLAKGAPESLMTYVQARALAGGTTTIQGWPSINRRPANQLVRNADDQSFDGLPDPVVTSTLTLAEADLRSKAQRLAQGKGFIYHCSEGLDTSIVTREFDHLRNTNCLREGLIGIHMTSLQPHHFTQWSLQARTEGDAGPGSLVWSPFSNLWLYGETTKVPAAIDAGVTICLGTDWGPSGTKNLLGELKVARIVCDSNSAADPGWNLSNFDLVKMVTANPGDTLSRLWPRTVGRLQPQSLADIVVVSNNNADPWANLVAAREEDIQLVAVGGDPRYGQQTLLEAAGKENLSAVTVGKQRRRIAVTEPADKDLPVTERRKWFLSRALRNLAEVQNDPIQAVAAPVAMAGATGPVNGEPTHDWLLIEPDMPGGPGLQAGPPPAGVVVEFEPVPSMTHDKKWLRSLTDRAFHGGLLDQMARYYPA